MDKDFRMLIRYAVIAYIMFNYGANSPLMTPMADLAVAGTAAVWGIWERYSPRVISWFNRE